ncbi:uncharacterized protein LOC134283612 [Saccostrea cucullata]|uniref:uncharacterized protein LOC134283612 n=1 Tax=Saccostrea cuccullata TaxID=36930 RepID=UPI002ED045B1
MDIATISGGHEDSQTTTRTSEGLSHQTRGTFQSSGYIHVQRLISIVNSFLLLHAVAFGLPSNLYLGVGYNILKANPDGGDWSSLGQDPGLLVTRNILDTAAGGQHYIKSTNYPQCSSALSTWVFYDPKTYQEYLRHYVTIDELTVSNVSLYAFSESQLYQDIKRKTFFQHDVFRDEISACPSLHARYTVPVVPIHKNLVTPEFARDACRLPALYNLQAYKHFLDNWGTHVTTEVEMGQKSATRYRLSVANLAEILLNSHDSNVASMLVEDFQGYGSVVHLNMSHIQHSDFSRLPLGTKISHFTIGAVTEAILSWTIIPISQVFSNDYWQNLDEFYRNGICDGDTMNLFQLKENFVKALNDYPIASGGEKPPSGNILIHILTSH